MIRKVGFVFWTLVFTFDALVILTLLLCIVSNSVSKAVINAICGAL